MVVYEATATAPVNIACIKYWGKRDTALILPTNSSLSITLDQDDLRSTTTSRADPEWAGQGDRLWLNGEEETLKPGGRLHVCITELRKYRSIMESQDTSLIPLSSYPLRIASYNNFPTAAGLASSASGLAALVASLSRLYHLPQSPGELSKIARQGSGSACRSLFGGFVAWRAGTSTSGQDSLADQVASESHWPNMHALICVVSDAKKGTSSTAGMQRTVETSTLFQHRLQVVPTRMEDISVAIQSKDFDKFAEITMADSNQFHAVCLDTSPPIFYLNDTSKGLIALVEEINRASIAEGKGRIAAYTFDAGPNCVIYALEENMGKIVSLVNKYFPQSQELKGIERFKGTVEGFNEAVIPKGGWEKGSVKSLIYTKVGDGPRTLSKEESLLNEEGMPKVLVK